MISLSDLTADVQLYWSASTSSDVPTQFPGVPLDASRLGQWMEFWITSAGDVPSRIPSECELQVLIDVHCFARQSDKRAVFRLADQVRTTLAQKLIPLHSSASPEQSSGHLRVYEAVTRDLTRESTPNPKLPLQHLLVSLRGYAIAVPAAEAEESV